MGLTEILKKHLLFKKKINRLSDSQKNNQGKSLLVIKGKKTGILFLPDWSYFNPYQKLLYESLNKAYDISVYGLDYPDFTTQNLKEYSGLCNVLHLHWIQYFYRLDDDKSIDDFFYKLHKAKELNYKIIWTVHNLVSHDSTNPEKEIGIRKRLSKAADYILVHGLHAKNLIVQEYGIIENKVHIVPHGHFATYYRNKISQNKARKKLNIPTRDFVFLCLGNIKAYKGIDELVRVFKKIYLKYPHSALLIVGRGLDKDISARIINHSQELNKIVTHLEFIPDEEIQLYMNASDVMVLPYTNVLTSGAAILALSFYKPVIAPNNGLLPELINDDIGYLFSSIKELEEQMENCVAKNSLKKMRKSSFKKKLNELDWNKIAQNAVFKEVFKQTEL